jgi:signal transduction histidine kinase
VIDAADLRAVNLFEGVADDALADLASAGEEFRFEEGDEIFRQGQTADWWWVLLDGRVELFRRAGREESRVAVMEQPGQWAGGFGAWNSEAGYMATGRAGTSGRMFRVAAASLGEWARRTFPLGAHLIAGFFQTARTIEAAASQRESLVALGTLAAGLAHEINNPAAAATRSVDALREACASLLASLVQLAERSLTAEQFIALDALRREIDPKANRADSLAAADLEDELSDWLEDRDVADAWRIAPALAAAGVDRGWLERAAAVLTDDTLAPGVAWVASTVASATLLDEVADATGRVSALVAAVKSYSQLDRASMQVIDVTDGLETTLVMLGHKLRDGITVVRDYCDDLPQLEANPGELNQVWTNLIDNAIDAMGGSGTLVLRTRAEPDAVVVEITDDGSGIPPDVQAHVFEPFFTTKDVGQGTGLGLDISRRIVVERHHGEITIASRPGETVVAVHLPRRGAG